MTVAVDLPMALGTYAALLDLVVVKATVVVVAAAWRVQRRAGAWGDPELVPGPLNSEANDIHSSATHRSVWVASRRAGSLGRSDIFRVGNDGTVEHLGPSINDELSQPDLWVSPDESWMILMVTDHPDGYGGDDLFVSRFEEGSWTAPENLGSEVNAEEYEYGPTVSPDGEYLYFNSWRRDSDDLYRIRLSSVPALAGLSMLPWRCGRCSRSRGAPAMGDVLGSDRFAAASHLPEAAMRP